MVRVQGWVGRGWLGSRGWCGPVVVRGGGDPG